MSNLVERLKLERRKETVLHTGRKVGYHLPDIQECIVKVGQIPMPAVVKMNGKAPTEEEAIKLVTDNPEAIEQGRQFTRLVVATMLDDIEGEVVEEDDRLLIVDLLEPSERQELFLIATRDEEPAEGKA